MENQKKSLLLKFYYRYQEFIFLFLIFLVGLLTRCLYFGSIPAGLNADEAAIGYQAYSLLQTGQDEFGFHFPAVLSSWGSGQNALYAWLLMPLIKIWGLNTIILRLPNLLFGLISLIIFYLLIKKLAGRRTGMISFAILAICPWHIILSRWGLESNLFPALFLLGFYFLIKAFESSRYLYLASILFGLCLYAYGTAWFFLPVFFLFSFRILFKRFTKNQIWFSLLIFFLFSCPILLYILINTFDLPTLDLGLITIPKMPVETRFATVLSLGNFAEDISIRILSFVTVLIGQLDLHRHNSVPFWGGGVYFVSILVILFFLIKHSSNYLKIIKGCLTNQSYLMMNWLFSALLCGIVMRTSNINRLNILFFPLIFLTALIIDYLIKEKKERCNLIIFSYLVFFIGFCSTYFFAYAKPIGSFRDRETSIKQAMATSEAVCFESYDYAMFFLYYAKLLPEEVKEAKLTHFGGVLTVSQYKNYYFDEACPGGRRLEIRDFSGLSAEGWERIGGSEIRQVP
jgi:4-amino-4-deoxy-L-arabinose transferase-like glycosyltransferase